MSLAKARQNLRESRAELKAVKLELKAIRRAERKLARQIRSIRYFEKKATEPEVTLDTLKESMDRMERTLSQLTLGNVQPAATVTRTITETVTRSVPMTGSITQRKPSALVMEVKSNPLFAKRVEASKNW